MTKILAAQPIVDSSLTILMNRCLALKKVNKVPFLKVVLVGSNPASVIYTANKKKFCEKIGARCEILKLSEDISIQEFQQQIEKINLDSEVHGLIIQLPVPGVLKTLNLNKMVKKEKDVDGFHPENLFDLLKADLKPTSLLPCTPKGIRDLLHFYNIPIKGKHVVVIGRSMIVGKPMALLMSAENATVTLCNSYTENLSDITKTADILVVAAGHQKLINNVHINPAKKTVVIDVGMNRDADGKLCGDVDFNQVFPLVSAITPVPGGVGPLTILSLVQNLITACEAK
ncbi:MAG: bifunctional 5,10-methylenetetrahydrofolate dehydrogenase/5,10-methenyltetrahydrofolate cyclohydrolase [Bacteriovoracaceae bacterium]